MKTFTTMFSRARNAALLAAVLVATLSAGMLATLAPQPAEAAVSLATATRNSRCTALVTYAGSSAKLKAYNGSRPSGTAAVSGGNTLLASGAFGLTIGTCTSGALAWDAGGFTQTNSGFVSGTPTFIDITTSGDVVVARVDICGSAPCWTFSGTVATGQNITLTSLAFTEGNL